MRALNRKLWRDLWGLRGPALAIAVVVASGVATWILTYGLVDSLRATQAAFYREYRFAEVFASVKRAPLRVAERVAALPGVERLEARVVGGANLSVPGFDEPVTGLLVSLPESGEPLLNRLYLRAGRLPEPRSADEVVVSEPFAEAHGLDPGDTLSAVINGRQQRLRVVGVGLSPEYVYQIQPGALFPDYRRYGILWLRRGALEAAQDMDGAFNDLALTLARGADTQGVIEALDRLLERYGGGGAYGRENQVSHEYLTQELKGLEGSAAIVPVIFLGVAGFLIGVVVGRIVQQQRDQVAVLKAFGYRNGAIAVHYLALVLLMVAVGALPGVALGAWLGRGMAQMYSEFFRFPFLHYVLDPAVVASALAVAGAAGVFGAWHAVRRAVAMPPAEAMRPEPPASYRATVVERLGLQRWLDQPSRMVLRHIERRPGKTALAVLGIAMGGGLLLVGSFQEDAIDHMIGVQFGLVQREDMTVTFTEPTGRKALFELAALPGVVRAEPFRAVPVRLRAGHREYRTAIQGLTPGADLHRVLGADLAPVRLPAEGLLLTEYLGRTLGVGAGDRVTVEVLEGRRPVREVRVAGLVNEYIGLSGYMQLDALNRLLRDGEVVSGAFLQVDAGHRQGLFDRLQARPRVAAVSLREAAIGAFYETLAETMLVMAFVNILLAGSIAFGVVYNSGRITLAEHARELASLRVLGFTRGEISYILLGELVLLTLAAVPLAFLIGYGFCLLVVEGLASELYRIPLVLEPSSYALTATVLLAAAGLTAALLRRRLNRLDLIEVLKTRE